MLQKRDAAISFDSRCQISNSYMNTDININRLDWPDQVSNGFEGGHERKPKTRVVAVRRRATLGPLFEVGRYSNATISIRTEQQVQ